jgi:hypothetical protein
MLYRNTRSFRASRWLSWAALRLKAGIVSRFNPFPSPSG